MRDFSYGDIVVEVDATRKSGPEDGYFGVICHFSDEGWNYIALVISDNGKYGILRMLNNKLEFLETGIDENSLIQKGIGQTNRIRGECSGGKYVLSVNGSQLVELLGDSFTNGDIGMIAGNRLSGDGISVLFDNFVLLQP